LLDYVPEKIKRPINEKLNSLKATVAGIFNKLKKYEFKETKSALKGITKQYTIDGQVGVDPKTFMIDVMPQATNLLSRNRQTKTNIVLTCEMERVDMKSGEVTTAVIPFATKAEVILESTDVNELL
jgi:alpha-mannosidase